MLIVMKATDDSETEVGMGRDEWVRASPGCLILPVSSNDRRGSCWIWKWENSKKRERSKNAAATRPNSVRSSLRKNQKKTTSKRGEYVRRKENKGSICFELRRNIINDVAMWPILLPNASCLGCSQLKKSAPKPKQVFHICQSSHNFVVVPFTLHFSLLQMTKHS